MRIGFLSMVLFAIFLTSYGTSLAVAKDDFAAAITVSGQKLSSRPVPAQISNESEEALIKKGYVRIGEISVDEVTGTYWGSDKIPETIPPREVTTQLLRKAADRGGDIVVLIRNNSPETYQVTRRGKVLKWERQSRTESYQQRSGTGDAGYMGSRTVYYNVPMAWETVVGTEQAVRSAGSVWRNDPELARLVVPKLEAQRLKSNQRQQAVAEIDRQALSLLQAAEGQVVVPRQADSIHDAARTNDVEKVKALLSGGANPNAQNDLGNTPLHQAVDSNAREAAELLLANGADVNARGDRGVAPLHYAAMFNSKDMAGLLIAKGADVNRKNDDGMTPMHLAASLNAEDVAIVLMANGADVNARSNTGSTPLHMAAMNKSLNVSELLLANGAEVNARVNNEKTPLHMAAFLGAEDVALLLLSKGADVNALDKDGKTPVALALQGGYKTLADALRAKGAK